MRASAPPPTSRSMRRSARGRGDRRREPGDRREELWNADDIKYRHKLLDEELRDIENDTQERIQRLREGLTLIDEKVEKKLLLAEDDWSKIDDVLTRARKCACLAATS